jgi:hypothetical protein
VFLATLIDRGWLRRRRLAVVAGAAVVLLALVETGNALVAPFAAPPERAWTAAAAKVRAELRPGDLIVAAPAWADPIMRLKLGDLVPQAMAGRMDAARYSRIWEIAQRGARAPDTAGATAVETARFGALTVRRWDKPAAKVTFDFLAEWRQATMSIVRGDGVEVPCALGVERFQCAGATLAPELLEIDTTLRNGLATDPVEGATLVLEYKNVPLASEIAVAAGLHNVWLRKAGNGTVRLRVLVDGAELGSTAATNASGWASLRIDTAARAGQSAAVRFAITVDRAASRHFGFAAEARSP